MNGTATATRLASLERLRDDNPALFSKLLMILANAPKFGTIELHFQSGKFSYVRTDETHR